MKISITILLLTLMSLVGRSQEKLGYMIVITTNNRIESPVKTEKINNAQKLLDSNIPNTCIKLSDELSGWPPYFYIEKGNKTFYIEKKWINKRGKYKTLKRRY